MASQQIGSLFVKISSNAAAMANQATKAFSSSVGNIAQSFNKASAGLSVIGVSTIAGLGVALATSAQAAIRFEDQFALVKKTMSDVKDPKVFEQIKADLLDLAQQLPIAAGELAKLGEVAGQLGVSADDLSEFVEVTGKLSVATNMTGQEAATSMARFLAVVNENTTEIGKFGAILVELGNNVAATESEIINLAQNFGAQATSAGLSAEMTLAFAAAMRETGQQSQAGATALGKFFTILKDAAILGGSEIAKFADVAGMNVDEFRRIVEDDIGGAAQLVLSGFSEISESGGSLNQTLRDLGLGNVRVARALTSLANNEEGLADAINRANKEAVEQNALNEEAEQRFGTIVQLNAQIKSTFNAIAIELGDNLLPLIERFLQAILGITKAFRGLARVLGENLGMFTTLATAGLGLAIRNLKKTGDLFLENAKSSKEAAKGFTRLGVAISKMGKAIKLSTLGPFLAVGVALVVFMKNLKEGQEALDAFTQGGKAVKEAFSDIDGVFSGAFLERQPSVDAFDNLLANLPEAVAEKIREGIREGEVTTDDFLKLFGAEAIPQAVKEQILNALDVGGTGADFATLDRQLLSSAIDSLKEIDKEGYGPLIKSAEEYLDTIARIDGITSEEKEAMRDLILLELQLVNEGVQKREQEKQKLLRLVRDELKEQDKLDTVTSRMLVNEEFLLKTAKDLAGENEDIANALGMQELFLGNQVDELTKMEQFYNAIAQKATDFQTAVNDITGPMKTVMALEDTEDSIVELEERIIELGEERTQVLQDIADINKEIAEVEKEAVLNEEELLEIQELKNEALKIEEQIRNGFALSAEDQLKKEKLKMDLAEVERAASMGSLQFADLERQHILDQIAEIDGKTKTQADADAKRQKAIEMEEDAQTRKEEKLIQLADDRAKAQERLVEIPKEIEKATDGITNAQIRVLDLTVKMYQEMGTFKQTSVDAAIAAAEALGLPIDKMNMLVGLAQKYNNETSAYFTDLDTTSATRRQGFQVRASIMNQLNNPGMYKPGITGSPIARHMGGSFKPGQNYLVGEYGPEMMKAFPGGGGQITPMGGRGSGDTYNTVNLNVSGMPSDPIAARRTAQLIQKELNKLKKDGRSGIVR